MTLTMSYGHGVIRPESVALGTIKRDKITGGVDLALPSGPLTLKQGKTIQVWFNDHIVGTMPVGAYSARFVVYYDGQGGRVIAPVAERSAAIPKIDFIEAGSDIEDIFRRHCIPDNARETYSPSEEIVIYTWDVLSPDIDTYEQLFDLPKFIPY